MTTAVEPTPQETAQRKMVRWGAVATAGVLAVVTLTVYSLTAINRQDKVIQRQNEAIAQVCRVAGGRVDTDPSARVYCRRVESGLPAVGEAGTSAPPSLPAPTR